MTKSRDSSAGSAALGERAATLHAAMLRINATLDVDTVLEKVVESARELANVPVIFVSGYGRDATLADALEAGAVDHIVKPFSPTELVARVRAALRQRGDSPPFVLGTLTVDYGRRRASVEGREIGLTATEFDLLAALSRDAGRVVTYETLLRTVWRGRPHASANLVRIFVRTLRRKLGDAAAEPVWIFNERVGYRIPAP